MHALVSTTAVRLKADPDWAGAAQVLCVIAERATPPAQVGVAEALVEALRSGRVPSGRRAAWGAVAGIGARADRPTARALGPIEFLCAWQAQPDDADALGAWPAPLHSPARCARCSVWFRAAACARWPGRMVGASIARRLNRSALAGPGGCAGLAEFSAR